MQAGAAGVVIKPFKPTAVASKVATLLATAVTREHPRADAWRRSSVAPTCEAAVRADRVVRRYRNGRGVGPIDLAARRRRDARAHGPERMREDNAAARAGDGLATPGGRGALVGWPRGRGTRRGSVWPWTEPSRTVVSPVARQRTSGARSGSTTPSEVAHRTAARSAGSASPTRPTTVSPRTHTACADGWPWPLHWCTTPALAVLDEPTAGLDPDGSARLEQLIRERGAGGTTTIVASNDPRFVEAVADTGRVHRRGVCRPSARRRRSCWPRCRRAGSPSSLVDGRRRRGPSCAPSPGSSS